MVAARKTSQHLRTCSWLPVAITMLIVALQPIFSAVWARLLLGEAITAPAMIGGCMQIGGAVIASKDHTVQRATAAAKEVGRNQLLPREELVSPPLPPSPGMETGAGMGASGGSWTSGLEILRCQPLATCTGGIQSTV